MSYTPTIGLEVHAELKTQTKMFCDCRNDPEERRPNVNVCPVCLAHPGALPVPNREAVYQVLRVGFALGAKLSDYTEFDRKSYFYPDIPKGYQITQYEYPFVSGGSLAGVPITRVHLEEDTARSSHDSGTAGVSLVDFNRAGVALMELVTEPALHDAATAGAFARELQLLLRTLGASDANLEKGEMRIEANISVSKTEAFGTKVEVKNINSFRAVERAIAYEIDRQIALLESGEKVSQETRGWDENTGTTFRQRSKEGSADYRYFPEPDIPKLVVSEIPEFSSEALAASMPELPWEKRARYQALGLVDASVDYLVSRSSELFDATVLLLEQDPMLMKDLANLLVNDVPGIILAEESPQELSPEALARLIRMKAQGSLSSRGTKDLLLLLIREGGDPESLATEHGLLQIEDLEALRAAVQGVLSQNPAVVEEYRGGKESVLQFLVGQAMKATKGAGNPARLRELLLAEIG